MRIGGDYLYPRLKYVWEYTERANLEGLQIEETLNDAKAKHELFEHECLSMHVFYVGFHKPWNNAVVENNCKDQAKYIKDEIDKHRACIRHVAKRQEFWCEHSKGAIVSKKLFAWTHDEYAAKDRVWPDEDAIQQEEERLTGEITDEEMKIPECVLARVKCMHQAIVEKAEEMLEDIVSTGKAAAAAVSAGAPNTNMRVEDIFQKMRFLHDRCAITRVGVLCAHRRVQRAPHLSGEGDAATRFSLRSSPDWMPRWLLGRLKAMARDEIEKWPSQQKRADLRWQRTQDLSDLAKQKASVREDKEEERREEVTGMEGGMIVLEGQDEAELLPPMRRLTLAEFESVIWEETPTWTVKRIVNQMRLHNLPQHKDVDRSDELDKKLLEKQMIGKPNAPLRLTFANREAAHKYLRAYLQLQKQVSEMVAEIAQVRARAQQQDGRDTRSSRRTRNRVARSDDFVW